jgi:hypothetical protein
MTRAELNRNIRALAHGVLGLTEDEYRCIVYNIYPKSGGHITNCDVEYANIVYMHLKRMKEMILPSPHRHEAKQNINQYKMIARLMNFLNWNWKSTAHFCYKITGHRTTKLCNSSELAKIIGGMIAIIKQDICKGKIVMTPAEKLEFEKHTGSHKKI